MHRCEQALQHPQPDKAFFGQKDAQQLAIIMRMVSRLNMNLEIKVGCPMVREEDGLAKSSRNTYLSAGRAAALCLSRAIFRVVKGGERNSARVAQAVTETIEEEPLARIDYVRSG